MKTDDIEIFNSSIDKRLSNKQWSRDMAAAVIKKSRLSENPILGIFSWLMPAMAAASIAYAIIFSSILSGTISKEQIQEDVPFSFVSEFYGTDDSSVEEFF